VWQTTCQRCCMPFAGSQDGDSTDHVRGWKMKNYSSESSVRI
jgi:hypothetical protein